MAVHKPLRITTSATVYLCHYCNRQFPTSRGRNVHVTNNTNCANAFTAEQCSKAANLLSAFQPEIQGERGESGDPFSVNSSLTVDAGALGSDHFITSGSIPPSSENSAEMDRFITSAEMRPNAAGGGVSSVTVVQTDLEPVDLHLEDLLQPGDQVNELDEVQSEDTEDSSDVENGNDSDEVVSDTSEPPEDNSSGANTSTREPCFDEATEYFMYKHPDAAKVFTLQTGEYPDVPRLSQFERRRRSEDPRHKFFPFASESEWELVKWLTSSGLSKAAIDRFCKLGWVSFANTHKTIGHQLMAA